MDCSVGSIELSYQERIKELEQEKHDLKERLWEVNLNIIYHPSSS